MPYMPRRPQRQSLLPSILERGRLQRREAPQRMLNRPSMADQLPPGVMQRRDTGESRLAQAMAGPQPGAPTPSMMQAPQQLPSGMFSPVSVGQAAPAQLPMAWPGADQLPGVTDQLQALQAKQAEQDRLRAEAAQRAKMQSTPQGRNISKLTDAMNDPRFAEVAKIANSIIGK